MGDIEYEMHEVAEEQRRVDALRAVWSAYRDFSRVEGEWRLSAVGALDTATMAHVVGMMAAALANTAGFEGATVVRCIADGLAMYSKILPLLRRLVSPAFKAAHWADLSTRFIVSEPFSGTTTLQRMIDRGVFKGTCSSGNYHVVLTMMIANRRRRPCGSVCDG